MDSKFFSKNRDKAYEEIKEVLYNRLKDRNMYAKQDPLKDPYFQGLQKGALSEIVYLQKLLDVLERS